MKGKMCPAILAALVMVVFMAAGCEDQRQPVVDEKVTESNKVQETAKQEINRPAESAPTASGQPSAEKSVSKEPSNLVVKLTTTMGVIQIELYPDKAPKTVENFLRYVDSGFYDGTIFHRVIKGFMIQGGGFTKDLVQKPTQSPIVNECGPALRNKRGTIAMARTNAPNSATCQFFINHADNRSLDFDGPYKPGYAVFGKVIEGMDVVDRIAAAPVRRISPAMTHAPVQTVVIEQAARVQ